MKKRSLISLHKSLGGLKASVIHIAGSKGKGTTAHLISEGLRAAGFKVGLYTSPHILVKEEMIQVDGEMISRDVLKAHLKFVDEKIREYEKDGPNEENKKTRDFEIMTLAAMKYFQDEKCDYVVVECGRGGKRDATNRILANKDLTILTHVELEHINVLGFTVEEITREKMGVCRPKVPLITPEAQSVEVMSEIKSIRSDVIISPSYELGFHHPECVGLAKTALETLGIEMTPLMKFRMQTYQIPGRFEIVPFGKHTFILDGAHTYDSIKFLEKRVHRFAKELKTPSPLWGVHYLKDKPFDMWILFPRRLLFWVDLDHRRAGSPPPRLPRINMTEIIKKLQTEDDPKLLVFSGTFKLSSELKKTIKELSPQAK